MHVNLETLKKVRLFQVTLKIMLFGDFEFIISQTRITILNTQDCEKGLLEGLVLKLKLEVVLSIINEYHHDQSS